VSTRNGLRSTIGGTSILSTKKLIATVAAGIIIAPGLVVYGTTTAAQGASKTAASKTPSKAEVAQGKPIFEAHCKACHGVTGEGTVLAPSLKILPRSKTITGVIEQLTNPLQRKSGTKMTNFDHILSAKEKEEVAAYVTVDITKTVK
jgi:mono/diheme cytochrome c family protein